MKNTLFVALLFSLFLVLATGASADISLSSGTSAVLLGGTSQVRDLTVTQTVTVTNGGASAANTLAVACPADAKYALTCTLPTGITSLGATGSSTASAIITLTAKVPKDFNAVDNSLTAVAFPISTLTVTANDGAALSKTAAVNMQAENRLTFRKGKVTITGSTNKDKSFSKNTKITDLRPGDSINVEVEAQNDFSRSSDVDFDDVDVTVSYSNDDDLDVNSDEETLSLNAGDKDSTSFSFDINDDASRKDVTATIRIDGKDSNGARHGEQVLVTFEIDRDPHDLVFRTTDLSPTKFVCGGTRNGQVTATILNRGRVDERDAGVEVKLAALAIIEKKTGLQVDEDDTASVAIPFTLPSDVKPGVYNVDVTTLYSNTIKNNLKSLQLTVDECKEGVNAPAPIIVTPPAPVVTTPPAVTTPPTATAVQKAKVTSALTDNATYTVLLGVSIVVVLVLIVAVLAFAFRKR